MKNDKGKIITVTSTKGGVGKTIITLNLAGIYSKLGYKVLVIDFDLYGGSIATYLNSNNEKTIFNLVEDLTYNRYESLDDYTFKYNDNISIISSVKDPRSASKISSKYIPLVLNNAIYKYDIILIDTSHILNEINIVTLDNSDTILYVLSNDVFDLKNTKSFMSIIKDVGYSDNCYVVLNQSIDPNKNYFSLYDIRNIIKKNIDFTISKSMYIKNIDKYIMDGEILILNNRLLFKDKNDLKKLELLAKTLIGEAKKWKKHYQKPLN